MPRATARRFALRHLIPAAYYRPVRQSPPISSYQKGTFRIGWFPRVLDAALLLIVGVAWAGQTEAAAPRTLAAALVAVYAGNPTLLAARANLRATDEGVPTALAGWRPQVTVAGTAGLSSDRVSELSTDSFGDKYWTKLNADNTTNSASVTITQPLYSGGKTRASTNKAESTVLATRAALLATEQQAFSDTVSAYVAVIEDQQLLDLYLNNERVLSRQLEATNDRCHVGEVTRTDVAQAEAALAGATSTRQSAEGTLQGARATYARLVGEAPPADLVPPQPLRLPTPTLEEAKAMAAANNPSIISSQFKLAAAKDNLDVTYSALMPTLALQGEAFRIENPVGTTYLKEVEQGGEVTLNLSIPLYQGGSEYAAVRQARQQVQQARKQVDDTRRQAVQAAISAWETYDAARAAVESNRATIRSNEIALEGVEREAIIGSRTTLDVLNAQQTLLSSRVTLTQNLASLVTASYHVAAAVGRLTARDLALPVNAYDDKAYYTSVHDRWFGTGDRPE